MGRPSNEAKRQAAVDQVEALRKEGFTAEQIRDKLFETGLKLAQVDDVCPLPATPETKTTVEKKAPDAGRLRQVASEAAEFLDYAHRKLQNVKPEHAGIRHDISIWSKRLKGAL